MYSWAQRPDTQVWDEPLYAHYLRVSGIWHPEKDEILASMEQHGDKVVQNLILKGGNADIAFFKQMTHHLQDIDDSFIVKTKNILFIRNSDEILSSYSKVIDQPTLHDIGVKAQFDLWEKWGSKGHIQAILDSKYLLMNPERVLRQLCETLEIPYFANMLNWKAGPRPEDGVWAQHWYTNVHKSTGFNPYQSKEVNLPERLLSLAEAARPYYEYLSQKSIR